MATFTKRGVDVFAPTTAGGALRRVINEDAQTWSTEVERNIDASALGLIQEPTWALLSGNTRQKAQGQPGRVTGPDTGTHTGYYVNDAGAIVSGNVQNTGEYSWSAAHNAWVRVGNTNIEQLQEDVEELQSTTAEMQTDIEGLQESNSHLEDETAYLLRVERERVPPVGFWPRPWSVTDQYGNIFIAANAETGLTEIITGDMPGQPLFDPIYRHSINDPWGRISIGVKWTGGVTIAADPLFDADYQRVEATPDGTIIRALRYDGSTDDAGFRGYAAAYVRGVEGSRHVYLFAEGIERRVTFGDTDNFAPHLSAGVIRYLSQSGEGEIEVKTITVAGLSPFPSSVTAIYMFLGLGQSLESGIKTTPVTIEPPSATRLLMFNGGVLTLGNSQNTVNLPDVLPDANIERLEPAFSQIQEAPVLQTGNHFLREMGAETGAVVGTYSIGSQGIENLGPGSQPFINLIKGVTRQAEMLSITGLTLTPVVPFSQGESDNGRPAGWYKPRLIALQESLTADINAAIGHDGEVVMILGQIASFTAYGRSFSSVPLEQLEVALEHLDRFICACPQYFLEYVSDGIHLTSAASALYGAYRGRAYAEFVRDGHHKPFCITSAVRTNASVVLMYQGGEGPIVIDTTAITDPGNYGFRWIDAGDGNAVSITSVTVTESDTITITLSDTPTGTGQMIGYADIGISGNSAGPRTGARGNVRDSSPDVSDTGVPMPRWAHQQQIIVTGA